MEIRKKVIGAIKILYVIAIFITSYFLFLNQFFTTDTYLYLSDLKDHIYIAMTSGSYSILSSIMVWMLKLPGNVFWIFGFEAVLAVGAGWFAYLLLKEMIGENKKDIAFLAGFTLLFLTSVYVPEVFPRYYVGTLITQPWHNITYFGMRLFAIWAMYGFYKIYERYLEGINIREWLGVAIPLLLATACKPNFLLSFAFSLLVILIIDFIKDYKKFWNIVKMGTTVFPACFVLLMQGLMVYGQNNINSDSSSIIIQWGGAYAMYSFETIILKIICGAAFPIVIFVCHHKEFDKKTNFAYLMFLITFAQVHLLEESGARANHGNFTWGIYSAAFILFIYALAYFIKVFDEKGKIPEKVIGSILVVLHVVSGFVYYILLLQGGPSYYL